MSVFEYAISTLAVIGLSVVVRIARVVGRIIRAMGITEFVVRFKSDDDNTPTGQLKK
jgi:predicted membrane-bound spermidine synthase